MLSDDIIKEELLEEFDSRLERHSNKNTVDPLNVKTLRYGITVKAYNQVLKNLKRNPDPDMPSGLKDYVGSYDLKKANRSPEKAVQRKLSDLVNKDNSQKNDLLKYVAKKYIEHIDSEFNRKTDDWFSALTDDYKKGLIAAAWQNPNRFLNNDKLLDGIICNNENVIKEQTLVYDYKNPKIDDGIKKRSLFSVAMMNGYNLSDDLDDYILDKLKTDPSFYENNIKCYSDIENHSKCLQNINMFVPELKSYGNILPQSQRVKGNSRIAGIAYGKKKEEANDANFLMKHFRDAAESLTNFTNAWKKMFNAGKEVNNGTGNENNNLQ